MVQTISNQELQAMLLAINGEISGCDSIGNEYTSIQELWDKQLQYAKSKKTKKIENDNTNTNGNWTDWYRTAYNYWENEVNCPISDDGVLGGYGRLTPVDVKGSNDFIDAVKIIIPGLCFENAADCGSGIGRVTKHLLLPRFKQVDLIEQSPRLLNASLDYIAPNNSVEKRRLNCINVGLQDFTPLEPKYDVIWIQWVIGHLSDQDFIQFFRRCIRGLKQPCGVIILKDNVCSLDSKSWTFVVDSEDSSVARNLNYTNLLLELSGLKIVKQTLQKDFPAELYPVMMTALIPME